MRRNRRNNIPTLPNKSVLWKQMIAKYCIWSQQNKYLTDATINNCSLDNDKTYDSNVYSTDNACSLLNNQIKIYTSCNVVFVITIPQETSNKQLNRNECFIIFKKRFSLLFLRVLELQSSFYSATNDANHFSKSCQVVYQLPYFQLELFFPLYLHLNSFSLEWPFVLYSAFSCLY